MNDEQQIRGELTRLAADDPLGPIDSARLVDRGRRGKRRRRILASGGAVAAVSAVALTASLLPNLSAADSRPSPAGTSSSNAVAEFTPLPGVPRGDAALGQLSRTELFRRCELRGKPLHRKFDTILSHYNALAETITMRMGDRDRVCWVPGDSRPSDATIAAAKADPLPSDDAGKLRNCSVESWHDMTKYRVLASDTQPGMASNLVAMSPSGRYVVFCTLYAGNAKFFHRLNASYLSAGFHRFLPRASALRLVPGSRGCRLNETPPPCIGWAYSGAGRLVPGIARLRLTNQNGRTHEIAVNDGWFALAWGNGNPNNPDDTVTAYDAAGNVVPLPAAR